MKGELDKIDEIVECMKRKKPETSLLQLKDKKKPGLNQQSTTRNHQEKLTKRGPKTIITKAKDPEPKPTPHVPAVDAPPVQGRKRKGDDKSPTAGVKQVIP